jgi:hypothetical protein
MIWLLSVACGQYIEADELTSAQEITAEVNLPERSDLETATTLGHYGLTGLLQGHTFDEQWAGGTMRSVDYSAALLVPDAGQTLADTLANLAAVDPAALDGQAEQLAFWMNLYNAWVLKGSLDQISADASWAGASASTWNGEETGIPWTMFSTRFIAVGDYTLSLDEVEHGVLRGAFIPENYEDEPEVLAQLEAWHEALWSGGTPDARLHMGVNCASRSCPDIPVRAFTADNVYDLLDDNAARFLAHPGKGAGPDGVSTLFNWFAPDFEATFGSVDAFVREHREGGDSGVNYDNYLEYNWELNGR